MFRDRLTGSCVDAIVSDKGVCAGCAPTVTVARAVTLFVNRFASFPTLFVLLPSQTVSVFAEVT